MAGIGDLVAHLGLDNSGFKKGLSSSRSMLSSFAGGVAGLISPIGAMFAGLAGTAGIGMLVKSSFEGVDALAKFGQKLGITADQAAGFQHAAELSGVSVDAMQAALQRANRAGLDIFAIADHIAAIEDPALRSKYAFDTLGKSGADLIPILMGGSAALKGMVDEGAKLSGLKGLDAGKIEEANDALSRAQAAVQGLGNMFAISLAPWVEAVAVEMQSLGMTAQFIFSNMGDYAELAWTRVELGAVSAWGAVSHFFTSQIPAVLTWFGDNWASVFFTAFDYVTTVFINLGQNIRNAMTEIWEFIKSGGTQGLEFAWVGLEEGFKNSISKLPDIPERAISDLERQLGQRADAIGEDLGTRLAEHLFGDGMAAPGGGLAEGLAVASGAKQTKGLKASLMGSQEAASIMLRGTGPGSDKIPEKQLGVQQQILIATKANKPQMLTPLSL